MLKGSCLCAQVKYVLSGAPLFLENCHCNMCRKLHGSAYTTFAKVKVSDFQFVAGHSLLIRYQSSPEVQRSFCKICGGKFTFEWEKIPDYIWLVAGTLDDDPRLKPKFHIFFESKASWHEVHDTLPKYPGFPPPDA